jgi:hypothetical protein
MAPARFLPRAAEDCSVSVKQQNRKTEYHLVPLCEKPMTSVGANYLIRLGGKGQTEDKWGCETQGVLQAKKRGNVEAERKRGSKERTYIRCHGLIDGPPLIRELAVILRRKSVASYPDLVL